MSEMNYKPNSHKSKEETIEKKRAEKVVTNPVKIKKKSEMQKLTDIFISEDAANVKSYILMDVLVPAVKKAISDIITNGIDMILYGGNSPANKRSTSDRVSYNRYYDRRDDNRYSTNRTQTGYSYDDIIMQTRQEAENVRERLDEMMDTYGLVRVADLYDVVGITGNYTDNDYGWTNIRNAEIIRVNGGYMLKMPRAIPIR